MPFPRPDTPGCIVTRYRVETDCGMYLTEDGEFTYEVDDAAQFRTEESAIEEAEKHRGSEVVKFQRWAMFPDFVATSETARAVA